MEEKKIVPMTCDDFMALELLRLVSTINTVKPESREYAQLLENLERFGATCTILPDIWKVFEKYYHANGVATAESEQGEPEIVEFKPKVPAEVVAEEAPVSEEPDSPIPDEEPMFDEPKEEPEEAPEYDATEVKKAIGKARADGKLPKIKDWLVENFGVEGFTALPASKYGEAMEKLKALGVEV